MATQSNLLISLLCIGLIGVEAAHSAMSQESLVSGVERHPASFSPSRIESSTLSWDVALTRERVKEFWIEEKSQGTRPGSYRLAQRRWGSGSSQLPLATVVVNEAFLGLEEQSRFASAREVETWMRELHRGMGISQSRGGWFGDTYFLMGNSGRLSRTVLHSIRISKGKMIFGTGLTYLAPQFKELVFEAFLVQHAWMAPGQGVESQSAHHATWSDRLRRDFVQFFTVPAAQAAPPTPSRVRLPGKVSLPSLPSGRTVRVRQPTVSIPALSEDYLRSVDTILVSSMNQKASDRIRQAGEETRRSIQEAGVESRRSIQEAGRTADQSVANAGREASRVVDDAGDRIDQSVTHAAAAAQEIQAQLLSGAGGLIQYAGQVLSENVDHAIKSGLAEIKSEGATIAAQVAIASTLGAGLADGFLSVGTHAIHYFSEWISGVQDERDFQKASDFLLQHSGLILAQRGRIRSILEQMDRVGGLTPGRLDQYSSQLKTKSHFLSLRSKGWDSALERAALDGDEDLHRELYSCRNAEARSGQVLSAQGDVLDRTVQVLNQKVGHDSDAPILPYLCDQIESELDRLLQLEIKTYEALHAYLKVQGSVAKRSAKDAVAFVQECTESGAETLKSSIQSTMNAFEDAVYFRYDDCELDQQDYNGPSEKVLMEQTRCRERKSKLEREFHDETARERQELVRLMERLERNPDSVQKACEDYGKLKSSSFMRPLAQVTKRYLCYSGGSGESPSVCLFEEGGPRGQGGFAHFRELKKMKDQKCEMRREANPVVLELGELRLGEANCKSLYASHVRPSQGGQSSNVPAASDTGVGSVRKGRAVRAP